MTYWHPLIADLPIPQPATIILPFGHDRLAGLLDGKDPEPEFWSKIEAAADDLGYPVFMRTDHSSAKHSWGDTCFVQDAASIKSHVWRLIEENEMADFMGLYYTALVLRAYIPLAAAFTAFNGLPIAPERRFFVRDGHIECSHFYWPAEALERGHHSGPLPEDWRVMLTEMALESVRPRMVLEGYALIAGARLPGYWSIDFAKRGGLGWMLIDCADGADSWHPEECPKAGSARGQENVQVDHAALLEPEAPAVPEPARS